MPSKLVVLIAVLMQVSRNVDQLANVKCQQTVWEVSPAHRRRCRAGPLLTSAVGGMRFMCGCRNPSADFHDELDGLLAPDT